MAEPTNRKKSALLSRRQALLNEIKYCEMKIDEARSVATNNSFLGDDSCDSESEFTVDIGPSITELKLYQKQLKTCLQATQELTSVTILQSEVNILVQDPVLNNEVPVSEEGVWWEVTAECRIDLVLFSINFYVHKPSRMFAAKSYRNLQVTLVKSSHEVELLKSVLTSVTRPSDAIEMIRNYSAAHRSRRTTLSRLAEKYSESLFMEPMPEGGYLLKCAGLLEVQWTLQNKWSPLAPFHHRMVFDLEFMDESYIKIISQLHRQVIDPTLETDERTLLLAKIINTCLEVKSSIPDQYESTESESESAKKLPNRRTTLDQEPQAPERKKKKDSEVMAPPKSLPKKSKHKGKENTVDSKVKPVKRTADIKGTENAKRSKMADLKDSETKSNSNQKSVIDKVKDNDPQKDVDKNNAHQNDDIETNVVDNNPKNSENALKKDKNNKNTHTDKLKKQQKIKDKISKVNENHNKNTEIETNNIVHQKAQNVKDTVIKKTGGKVDSKRNKENVEVTKDKEKTNKVDINKLEIASNKSKNTLPTSNTQSTKQKKSNDINVPHALKRKESKEQIIKTTEQVSKESSKIQKVKEIIDTGEKNNKESVTKSKNQLNTKTNKHIEQKERNASTKVSNLIKTNNVKSNTVNYIKNQFISKKSQGPNKVLTTKIPRKRVSIESGKNNLLRVSPRKLSNLKPVIQNVSKNSMSSQKSLQKVTNIPRLLKKPQIFKPKV